VTPDRLPVGKVEDFRLNEFRTVEIPGGSIGVVRTERGFFAIRNRCPHQGAELCRGNVTSTLEPGEGPFSYRPGMDHMVVRCPWHRWEFAIDSGIAVGQITTKKVVTYAVEVEGDAVFVNRKSRAAMAAARKHAGARS
jgi:nitrite reductase (NADH) small subunit